ncbi:hypothetical protein KAI65_02335 [Candidatus Parcubacteria bacterium]|nr:hypothetical protein [Candidatus Parcubacteria bacterium]
MIDGIKPSKKEIENSRSIVLESIGENIQAENKAIDSLSPPIKKEVEIKPVQSEKEKEPPKIEKVFARKKALDSLDFLNPADKSDLEERKIDANFKEKIDKKIKQKIKKKKTTKVKKLKNKNFSQIKKDDKKPNKPKIKKNYFKIILKLISNFLSKHKNNFIKSFKRSLSLCFLLFVIFMLLYFALITTVLKFNIDNNFFRQTNKYIPIPAFIARGKVIDYYLWQDIIASANDKTEVSARAELAKYLVINELTEKYNLPHVDFLNLNDKEIIKAIAERTASDAQVNQVAINRIYSIKEMIKTKNDFIRVSEKYGDELGKATITARNKDQYPYADAIEDLKVNEVSKTINTQDGHYIFLCFEKTMEKQVLSYVFIKNKPFEQILNELIAGYRIISFVD